MLDGDETILARTKSPFQEIKLTRLSDGKHALYLDDAIQFVSGFDDDVYHGVLASLPARMLGGLPGNALILGGGDGLAARNLLRYPNIGHVQMVELDPGMIEFCSKNPVMRSLNGDVFQNPRLKVKVGDARQWVDRYNGGDYQIAILDFPDPLDSSLEDLFQAPFYKKVNKHVDPRRGIYSVQSSIAFGDVEDQVKKTLSWATKTRSYPVRFKGKWMQNGTIVFGGSGVNPKLTRLSDKYRADQPEFHEERLGTLAGIF